MDKRSIVHVEIPAANRDKLAKFYADMFDWKFQHMTEPSPYTTFEAGNTGGGYPDVGENAKAGDVLVYVDSDDIEADLKKIERLGGKTVMPKTAVGTMGWFAIFADPTGNKLALWTATNG